MPRNNHKPGEIVAKLREVDVLTARCKSVAPVAPEPFAQPIAKPVELTPERLQPQQRRDLLMRLHDLPLRTVGPQRASCDSPFVHQAPSSLHEVEVPNVVTGAVCRIG